MSKTTVLLVDDLAILRDGLRALLSYCDDIEVVGDAGDGAEAIRRVRQVRPDIVVMGMALPGSNAIDATRHICDNYPETRVLILTQYHEPRYVLPLLHSGASGCLPKQAPGAVLIAALRRLARGETFFHPCILSAAAEAIRGDEEQLTAREAEILQLIVRGQSNPQIAATLSLSIKTVEWHRTNLMGKLRVHNVADLIRCALRQGLVELDDVNN